MALTVIEPGRLSRRVTIQQNTPSRDAVGEPQDSWSTLATVWAEKLDLRGQEFFEAQQDQAELTTRWRIRYRSDVTPKMRISHDGVVYDIEAVVEIGHKQGLELMTRAQVPQS